MFIKLKKKPKLSLKDPQSIKAHGGGESTDPFIISEYFDILNKMTNNIHSRQLQKVDETSFCLDIINTEDFFSFYHSQLLTIEVHLNLMYI